jgi:hypothetical protein
LKCVAKIQANNSWDLSAVPALPVLELVGEHISRLYEANVDGILLSWTLGGYPSANLSLVNSPPGSNALDALAKENYGEGAPIARSAWKKFSDACREYPFDGGVIYNAPVQLGPANLLFAKKSGYAATMVGIPYDDVRGWCGPYPPEILAAQYEKVARGFADGITDLEQAIGRAPQAKLDLGVAEAAQIHFQSVANQVRFILARDQGEKEKMKRILQEEKKLAVRLFKLTREDSRIGFEASNQYYYLPQDLMEKVINCDYIERHLPLQ